MSLKTHNVIFILATASIITSAFMIGFNYLNAALLIAYIWTYKSTDDYLPNPNLKDRIFYTICVIVYILLFIYKSQHGLWPKIWI